ncbi:MAG: hypothetical protein JW839_09125, partial [Candidatus Lokiarchaeota archaeon]|nr:hypothetical protein [Candidatus Lokiarchaeota archaeon]
MFSQLLDATRIACSGAKARPFTIGIGLAEPRVAEAVAGEIAATLGSPRVTLVAYHHAPGAGPFQEGGGISWHSCAEPAAELLSALKAGRVHAAVRGQLPSSNFLAELKRQFNVKRTCRLALLSTAACRDFFFAPVGIDEGGDSGEKERLIELAADLLQQLCISPSFYLLSAGRLGDT